MIRGIAVFCLCVLVAGCGTTRYVDDAHASQFSSPVSRISPIPMPPQTPPPGGVSARQVVDAITAEGLPATDPRDNTSRMCSDVGCIQLVTTDDFSVYQFPDAAAASKWAAGLWPSYANGMIALRYTEGGSHPTNPLVIPQYNAILDRLVAQAP